MDQEKQKSQYPTQIVAKRRKLPHLARLPAELKKGTLEIPTQAVADRPEFSHLPQLPLEVQLQILTTCIIPSQSCITYYLGKCVYEWFCDKSHYKEPLLAAASNLLSVSTTWRNEGLKYFFANNTFVFNTDPYRLPRPHMGDEDETFWKELRDPHATRLLDFIDRPDWKGKGSKLWRHNFSYPHAEHIDRYRHTIQKLALVYQTHHSRAATEPRLSDWDWILKVDWKTLPDLEILFIDYKGTVELQRWEVRKPLSHQETMRDCAERMKCLNLKKLVLMNVAIGSGGVVSEFEEKELRGMWEKSLAPGGELVIQIDDSKEW